MKRLIVFLMVGMLIIFQPVKVYADAGQLTIIGGTTAIGGLSGAALAGLAGPAVVAVFIGMMAVGMDIKLTQASEQAGMTKTQFLQFKIEQYCNEAQITAGVFYKGILDGSSVTKNGLIELSDQGATQIKQFINWLYDTDQVSNPVNNNPAVNTVTLGNLNAPLLTPGDNMLLWTASPYGSGVLGLISIASTSVSEVAVICTAANQDKLDRGSVWFYLISNGNTQIDYYFMNTNTRQGLLNSYRNGYWYLPLGNWIGTLNPEVPVYKWYGNDINDLLDSWDGAWNPNMDNTASTDGFTGSRDEWNQKQGLFDPTANMPTVLNPGVSIPVPADKDISIDIGSYLDALQRVLDKLADRTISGVDKADGIPIEWDIPDVVTPDPAVDKDDPVPNDDKTPITSTDPVDPSTNPTMAAGPLKFNLTNIFPFCIPFDIKDMLTKLSAEPVAPNYTINWNIPIINTNLQFTVDLSQFNNIALICRRMELLLFIIGLAIVTRNLIRG